MEADSQDLGLPPGWTMRMHAAPQCAEARRKGVNRERQVRGAEGKSLAQFLRYFVIWKRMACML